MITVCSHNHERDALAGVWAEVGQLRANQVIGGPQGGA